MFSIYTKVITPEISPVLGPAQSPPCQIMDPPLDDGSRQPQEQLGGFGLLCACCTSSRCTTRVSEYGIAILPDISAGYISIQTHPPTPTPPTIVLEKCKDENHFTHYNYRVTTPREMPPF
jgi:hypothetical protein